MSIVNKQYVFSINDENALEQINTISIQNFLVKNDLILTFANSEKIYRSSFFMKLYFSVFCENTRYQASFIFLLCPNHTD